MESALATLIAELIAKPAAVLHLFKALLLTALPLVGAFTFRT